VLAFIFARLFGEKPRFIAARYSTKTLRALAILALSRCLNETALDPAWVANCFAPLLAAVKGREGRSLFQDHYSRPEKATDNISDWIWSVKDLVDQTIIEQEGPFLQTVFRARPQVQAHLLLHYAFVTLLHWDRPAFAQLFFDTRLLEVEAIFENDYMPARPFDTVKDRLNWVAENVAALRQQVEAIGDSTMGAAYFTSTREDISGGLDSLGRQIAEDLYRDRNGLLFAYIRGYL
jgi:hypothetical protein